MVLDSSGHGSRVQLNGLTVHLNKRGKKKKKLKWGLHETESYLG